MRTKLKLFLEWGIKFEKVYEIEEKSTRKVAYADRRELEEEIIKHHIACEKEDDEQDITGDFSQGGKSHADPTSKPPRESPLRTD